MSIDTERFFDNPWRKEDEEISKDAVFALRKELQPKIEEVITSLIKKVECHVTPFTNDYSVYTGTCGFALLFLKLGQSRNDQTYIQRSFDLIHSHIKLLKRKRCTFLTGDAGPLAIAATAAHALGLARESAYCVDLLEKLANELGVAHSHPDLPDELLYGRAGYLYALLFVEREMGARTVSRDLIGKVAKAILDSGRDRANSLQSAIPLYYEWHDKCYLAAAHGYGGVLYLLLLVRQRYPGLISELDSELIQTTIDYLVGHRLPSGNFPSSLNNKQDKLVQWCHGAPGMIHMLCEASKVYSKPSYMEAAVDCALAIWERGLLKKGYGICHGVSGNAYAFLRLYQETGQVQYLHHALRFAQFCCDYGKHGCRQPDRPYSLFEGMAGTLYFFEDILSPELARFPAYEL